MEDETPGAAQILVMGQQCWDGSPWGRQRQDGGVDGSSCRGEALGWERGALVPGVALPCVTQDRFTPGGSFLLCDKRDQRIAPKTPPRCDTVGFGGPTLAGLSCGPSWPVLCLVTWSYPFLGPARDSQLVSLFRTPSNRTLAMLWSLFSPTSREGCSSSNLSLETQSGPLFSLPLLQEGISGPSVPTPPGEGHNLISHSVCKLGLQTALSCAL